MMGFVNVIIDNKNKAVDRLFTYSTQMELELGQKVKVPFVGGKLKDAVVVEKDVIPQIEEEKIKSIEKAEPVFLNEEMVKTAIWMKARYGIRYIDAFNCFLPKGKTKIADEAKNPLRDYIKASEDDDKPARPALTKEQDEATSQICQSIAQDKGDIYLLDGVTSSGKTLVYLEACEKALSMGKTAIVLVPEIGLTGQTVERFVQRFGEEQVALLHSKLTTKERFDQWDKLKNGMAKIAIGARIGVFAPLDNIGLIILDEEHETTYKSDQTPKYDTVDIALKRLMHYNGVLVLGSATPSIVSYERVESGIYKHIKLTKRYNNTPLPDIEVVNMGEELKAGNLSILSRRLRGKLDSCLERDKQAILFLNRRGYSNYVSCRGCGETQKCPECNITTTYHKQDNKLVCHYCGKKYDLPTTCPECGSKYIKHVGIGTEQVEEIIKKEYPNVSVDRLDIDSGKTRKQIETILENFRKGKTRILIGTQLVAKGLDFSKVDLVGIISADSALNLPDYRAAERTYQLITQVAGRAGRGEEKGTVIVQTYEPKAYPIRFASKYDYQGFYNKEVNLRKALGYPPFSDLVLVSFTHKSKDKAIGITKNFIDYAKSIDKGILRDKVFDFKESATFKGNGSYRYYTLIKCPKGYRNKLLFYINDFEKKLIDKKEDCIVIIDVNPYSMF